MPKSSERTILIASLMHVMPQANFVLNALAQSGICLRYTLFALYKANSKKAN